MRILSAFLAFLGLTACGAAATTGSSDSTVLPQPEASASVAQPGPAPASEPVAPPASSCAEWNDLDKLNTCTVNVGAKVVIGPGQSAECENNVTYPQSLVEQVLIIREQDGKVPVSDCKETWMVWGP